MIGQFAVTSAQPTSEYLRLPRKGIPSQFIGMTMLKWEDDSADAVILFTIETVNAITHQIKSAEFKPGREVHSCVQEQMLCVIE